MKIETTDDWISAMFRGIQLGLNAHIVDSAQREQVARMRDALHAIATRQEHINPNGMRWCASCGAPIHWQFTTNNVRAPFDVLDGVPSDRSHFVSCPKRREWRNHRRSTVVPARKKVV